MKERALRLFNLYSGEGFKAFLIALLGYLLSLALSSATKLADALFLIHLGSEELPKAYGCVATLLILAATVVIWAFNRFRPATIFRFLLFSAIFLFSLVCFSLYLELETVSSKFWFILKVTCQVLFVQSLSTFWNSLDQYYHFQDAKRLYTLFNCSIYIGAGCSGLLIQSGMFSVSSFFMIVLFVLVGAQVLSFMITRTFAPIPDDSEIEDTPDDASILQVAKACISSRYTTFLMLGNLTLFLLMTTSEYSYLSSFDRVFDVKGEIDITPEGTSYGLTKFLGTLLSSVSVGNLIIGWFLYSRLIQRFGVTNLILITPFAFFVTFLGWQVDTSLLFPILGFITVEGLYAVIEDNNFNLTLNAVPLKLKYKVRILIESFSEPLGMLISSILLSLPFVNNLFLGLILSIISLTIAFTIRGKYFRAILSNLADYSVHVFKTTQGFFSTLSKKERTKTEHLLLSWLSSHDPHIQSFASEAILDSKDEDLIKKALKNSITCSDTTKLSFMQFLEFSDYYDENYVLDALSAWQKESQSRDLIAQINFYFAKLGLLHPDKAYYSLESDNLIEQGAAILSFQSSYAKLSHYEVTENRTKAIQELQRLLRSEDEEELCLGITLLGEEESPQNIELLLEFLKSPSIKVATTAAIALQLSCDSYSVPYAKPLLDALSQRRDLNFRIALLKVLCKIGHRSIIRSIIEMAKQFTSFEARLVEKAICELGLKTVPTLVGILRDTHLSDRSRIIAGKILAKLSLAQLNLNLYDIIRLEIEKAYFYYYYAKTLNTIHNGIDLTLLKSGLYTGFESGINFIIQLLSISKWIENSDLLVLSLRSTSTKIRNQGIETLETCCNRKVFRLLWPLISLIPDVERIKYCHKYTDTSLSLSELLDTMEHSACKLDVILAFMFKYRMDLPNWRTSLRKQMASKEEIFHQFAYELLEL